MNDRPGEPEMRNPFRSEADAFRILVMIVVVAAAVIAAALLVGSWLGVVLGLIAIAFGLKATVGWLRVGLREPDAGPDPAVAPRAEERPGGS